jgi:hypothetical protein
MEMYTVFAYRALVLGTALSLLNFYLSFVRVPLLRACGRSPRLVSGFPLCGSMLLVVSAVLLWPARQWALSALAVATLDTGGIHWFCGELLWQTLAARIRHRNP